MVQGGEMVTIQHNDGEGEMVTIQHNEREGEMVTIQHNAVCHIKCSKYIFLYQLL